MKEDNKLITFAIHSYEKAMNVKNIFEKQGIKVVVEKIVQRQPLSFLCAKVRIQERDLPRALNIIEGVEIDAEGVKNQKIVLIPVDFSEYSKNACKVGFRFAEQYNMSVVILHSYLNQVYSGVLSLGELLKMEKNSAENKKLTVSATKKRMSELKEEIASLIESGVLPKVDFKCEVIEGVPEDVILDYAKSNNPTIIVMGTRGIHRKEQDMIGSVTAEVLDSTKHLLFIVPEHVSTTDVSILSNIVFYTNLEETDLASLDIFMRRLDVTNMNVTIMHIDNKKEAMVKEKLNAILEYCKSRYEGVNFIVKSLKGEGYMSELEDFLTTNKTDVVVIPNKRRNMFSRIFNPSLAHRMLFQKDIPMLVVPTK